MQGNKNFEAVEEAYHSMTAEAAEKSLEVLQMYAALYPRELKLELVRPVEARKSNKQLAMLKALGELSPIGLCLVNWDTRLVEWRNNAYSRVFLSTFDKESQTGVRLGDLMPEFTSSGVEAIFEKVANTGEPFLASAFPLTLASGLTHWNASIAALPSTEGETYLFLQLQRVEAPAQTLAA